MSKLSARPRASSSSTSSASLSNSSICARHSRTSSSGCVLAGMRKRFTSRSKRDSGSFSRRASSVALPIEAVCPVDIAEHEICASQPAQDVAPRREGPRRRSAISPPSTARRKSREASFERNRALSYTSAASAKAITFPCARASFGRRPRMDHRLRHAPYILQGTSKEKADRKAFPRARLAIG